MNKKYSIAITLHEHYFAKIAKILYFSDNSHKNPHIKINEEEKVP